MQALILHVGFPKTGTSTLQNGLFRRAGVVFGGKFSEGRVPRFPLPWVPELRDAIAVAVSPHAERRGARLLDAVRETLGGADGRPVLVSLEGLTNPLVDTHSTQMKDIFVKADDAARILRPLAAEGVSVRILITVRDQARLLPSFFAQHFAHGPATGLYPPDYDRFLDFCFEDELLGLGPTFEFDAVAERYAGHFGGDAVTVLSMEDLMAASPGPAHEALGGLLDQSAARCVEDIQAVTRNVRREGSDDGYKAMHVSPGARQAGARMGLRVERAALTWRHRLGLKFGRPVRLTLPDRGERIAAYYAPSNARLAERWGVSLGPSRG